VQRLKLVSYLVSYLVHTVGFWLSQSNGLDLVKFIERLVSSSTCVRRYAEAGTMDVRVGGRGGALLETKLTGEYVGEAAYLEHGGGSGGGGGNNSSDPGSIRRRRRTAGLGFLGVKV
jgi:hypothetical protein